MRLPDIPAIALGALGLAGLSHVVEPPAFALGLADNTFIATCLEGLAKYSDVCTVSLYVAAIALILSGILRIWLDNGMARWIWAIGSAAVAVPIMAMLNETVFAWAWDCDLYSAGTTEVVLTVFHLCWISPARYSQLTALWRRRISTRRCPSGSSPHAAREAFWPALCPTPRSCWCLSR